MTNHLLKIDPEFFKMSLDGTKPFEIRFNDKNYQVGDLVTLKETLYTHEEMLSEERPLRFTGREVQHRILSIHDSLGVIEGYVVLGLERVQ